MYEGVPTRAYTVSTYVAEADICSRIKGSISTCINELLINRARSQLSCLLNRRTRNLPIHRPASNSETRLDCIVIVLCFCHRLHELFITTGTVSSIDLFVIIQYTVVQRNVPSMHSARYFLYRHSWKFPSSV